LGLETKFLNVYTIFIPEVLNLKFLTVIDVCVCFCVGAVRGKWRFEKGWGERIEGHMRLSEIIPKQ
jgi:hypothetical protein